MRILIEDQSNTPKLQSGCASIPDIIRGVLVSTVVTCFGCSDPNAGVVTDMHKDFDHKHKHQHSEHDNHEHEHTNDFSGSHSHEHAHGHRHDEPVFGGRLFSIGHTHHETEVAHFHAEVMPLKDNTIRFHLLSDSAEAGLQVFPIAETEVIALVSAKGQESVALERSFTAAENRQPASEFGLTIPESIADADEFSIVVPKLKIGGQRQNFSFHVRRIQNEKEPAAATHGPEESHE